MIVLLIIGAIISWILVGLAMIAWMVNRTERIFGQNREEQKVHFNNFFTIKSGEDLMWFGILAFAALFWPILLALTFEMWAERARRIIDEAKYE